LVVTEVASAIGGYPIHVASAIEITGGDEHHLAGARAWVCLRPGGGAGDGAAITAQRASQLHRQHYEHCYEFHTCSFQCGSPLYIDVNLNLYMALGEALAFFARLSISEIPRLMNAA
jgi:hypothetical protein